MESGTARFENMAERRMTERQQLAEALRESLTNGQTGAESEGLATNGIDATPAVMPKPVVEDANMISVRVSGPERLLARAQLLSYGCPPR